MAKVLCLSHIFVELPLIYPAQILDSVYLQRPWWTAILNFSETVLEYVAGYTKAVCGEMSWISYKCQEVLPLLDILH